MAGFAWVTLATNDSYSLGALVLANSLRQVGTTHQLAVLVTPGVTNAMREQLRSIFNVVVEVNILDSKDEANLRLLQRPELGVTFTKLHCWRLTQFEKCVFLDADTLVLQNADELFEREELSAAPDVGWPDCFNSGVFVYRPSNATYENLVKFALERGSFDGGDQGLLNLYFSDWAHKDISKHLPFIYNTCSTASYSYLPAFKQFGAGIKIIHFIGPAKPWLQYFDTESRQVQPFSDLQHLQPVLQHWWDLFFSFIQPNLSSEMARSKSSAVHNPQPYPQPFYTSFTPSPSVTYEQNTCVDYKITTENESGPESDYKNVWDPWEEYEQKTDLPSADLVEHSTQLIAESITNIDSGLHESHNTNAHSVLPTTTALPTLFPPPPPQPAPIQLSIPTFHPSPSIESKTNKNYTNFVEIKSAPQRPPQPRSPPPLPQPPPQSPSPPPIETPDIPVENQCSYANNNSANDFPPRIQTPPLTHQTYAQPHEFEPLPCTVANESILHPNDNGSDNNDGDAGLAGAFSQLKLGEPRSPGQLALEDHLRRQGWEVGNIDYLGKDSFENIWKKICQTIDAAPKPKEPTPPPPATEVSTVPPSVAPQTVPKELPEQIATAAAPASVVAPAAPAVESPAITEPQAPEQVQAPPAAVSAESAPAAVPEQPPAPAEVPPTAEPSPIAVPAEAAPIVAEPPTPAAAAEPTPAPIEPPTEAAAPVVAAEAAPEALPPVAPPSEAVVAAAPELPAAVPEQTEAPPAAAPEQAQEPPAAVSEQPQSPPAAVPEQVLAPLAETQAPSESTPEQPEPVAPSEAAPAAPLPEQPQPVAPSEAAPLPEQQPQPVAPSEAAPAAPLAEQPQAVAAAPAPSAEAATVDAPKEAPAETAKAAAASKSKEGAKKSEGKPATEPTSPTPPPRKAGSSPKKTKAKK